MALSNATADTGNPDVSDYVATWDDSTNSSNKGYIIIKKRGTPATFAIFTVSGSVTDNTSWLQVAVTHTQSNGTFSATDELYVQFFRTGDDGAGSLSNVVEDTTPQLGGQLDVNGQAIGDGTRELITFTEDGSAVNHINIENQATGAGPIISAAGDDANIDLHISAKGTGALIVDGTSTDAASILLAEDTDNGTNSVGFKAPASIGTTVEWVLPSADGSSGDVLQTNGSGTLSFAAAAAGGAWTLLSSSTASSSASITFTTGIDSTYDTFVLVVSDILPQTDTANLFLELSADGGSTWTTNTVRTHTQKSATSGTTYNATSTTGAQGFKLNNSQGNVAAGEAMNGVYYLSDLSDTTQYAKIHGTAALGDDGGSYVGGVMHGVNEQAGAKDALRLIYSAGNIVSGRASLFGIKHNT